MTDEEMAEQKAEEYVMREDTITENDRVPFDNGYGFQTVDFEKEVKKGYKDGFLAGLKAGRPQWHKVADGNPENENDILCQISKDEVEVGYYHTKQKRYYTIDGQPIDVIRWQEIIFPKELAE